MTNPTHTTAQTGPEYLAMRRAEAQAQALQKGAAFVALHVKSPLFQKRMGRWLVRFDFPGVLQLLDPDTGEVFAESQPGKPATPKPGNPA